ncbi:prepilin-type N-terminal cleavage/methylation domain-containing protein [Tropicibacter sp. R15_0]|uniref:type IV pilus modification PilV family protein n=1 Tax=Tropicibacter sp. R15_0 TaxID=2821101 RepID=UPI001ADC1A1F|nr:prepilin-type N-terminal cleavage/methylation domain-containing protein [Tropicibacter sp. R15_0]MBO9463900.1 prepilin-type N-terminal cleavage/methylation domain-containing protein [Tropicibacter sp. R15_0]
MFRKLIKARQDKGITLVELAVAILILTIGTIGALQAVDQSQRNIGAETPRLLARLVARNHVEQLQLLGPNAQIPTQVQMGPYEFKISVDRQTTAGGLVEARVTARSSNGEGAQLVTYLSRRTGP